MTESLLSYFHELSKCKILDKEELNRLIIASQNGDLRARDKVVKSNLRFVVTLAKSFNLKGMTLEDLISSGNEGLLIAISKYKPDKNVPFTSYAAYWIKQSMYYLIYYNRDTIRLPLTQRIMANKIAKCVNECVKTSGYTPTTIEISEKTGIPESTVDYLASFNIKPSSLDAKVNSDEGSSQLQEIIPSEYNLEEEIHFKYVSELVQKVAKFLSNKEKDIINLSFGTYGTTLTLQEIANLYGVSKERIRQIKDKAIDRLRNKCKDLHIDIFSK